MKTLNYLLVTAATVVTFQVTLSAQAAEPAARPSYLPKNRAVLASPRTLEEFPELARTVPAPSVARRSTNLKDLAANRAVAASPRFREEHPELLRPQLSAQQFVAQAAEKRERLAELTENRALANSPRFLEEHPEISRGVPVVEVAPLK